LDRDMPGNMSLNRNMPGNMSLNRTMPGSFMSLNRDRKWDKMDMEWKLAGSKGADSCFHNNCTQSQ
jgi:hypothetical protein